MKTRNLICILSFISLAILSCKKLDTVDPPLTQLDAAVVYTKDANAIAVLSGLYQQMNAGGEPITGTASISTICGLSADELIAYQGSGQQLLQAYQNNLTSANTPGVPFWQLIYPYIYTTNTAIEGLSASTTLTPAVKLQLLGEAKFMRAFFYFYLVNIWGDVPLITSTDYAANMKMARTPATQVYRQMINDLTDAQGLLSSGFVASDAISPTTDRIRPTSWAATALLARVYLYKGALDSAEAQATAVISDPLFSLTSLDSVFLANSTEAIWQLLPTIPDYNTQDAVGFVLTSAPNYAQPTSISSQLLAAFEPGDNRLSQWIDSISVGGSTYYYPYKYKVYTYDPTNAAPTEYLVMERLSEQYLIRAEARMGQQNVAGALADLDVVRERAGLPDYAGPTDQTSVSNAILHERQVELFTEWGHRWFDLKRTNNVDAAEEAIMSSKGSSWNSNMALYPVPAADILLDAALTQNSGYQ